MSVLFMISMVIILGFTGVLLAIMPLLVKRSEAFAVTVPSAAFDEPDIKRIRSRYMTISLVLTAIMTVMTAVSFFVSENAFMVVFTGAILLLVIVAFALYLNARSQVMRIKAAHGWEHEARAEVSAVIPESASTVKAPPSLWWNLLYAVIMAATLVVGLALYQRMPAQVSLQTDFAGHVTNSVPRSRSLLYYTPALQIFLGIIFSFVVWMMGRARRDIDPAHPVASAARSAVFVRVQSIFMLAMGLVLTASMAAIQLSFVDVLSINTAGIIVLVASVVMMVGLLIVSLRYGQFGARLAPRAEDEARIMRDDDRYWKLGMIYCNPDDPAVFVPKRFGVGWTNNVARPLTWVLAGGLIVLCAALVWGSMLLTK
ncbi:MAG: DUF5808 domain-containing protein [Actinomycetia bacterium]|nr:DUF5808 domain-containing protein [Actinomycetes bacterium]